MVNIIKEELSLEESLRKKKMTLKDNLVVEFYYKKQICDIILLKGEK